MLEKELMLAVVVPFVAADMTDRAEETLTDSEHFLPQRQIGCTLTLPDI
jgi:hypothetical protein